MPIGPAITWALTVAEKTPRAAINWILNISSGRFDFLRWDLTVSNFIDVATRAWRMIGARIEMDLGDGALSTVTAAELGSGITLRGSINGFGVRELTFSRYGEDQTPFKSTLLRGMCRVRMTGYRGIPGAIGSREMFDGYVRDTSFQASPPLAQFDCQDTSLAYAETPIAYNLEPGSLRERPDVILDVLAQVGIPAGVFEAPHGSGIVFKALSEAGDRKVAEWLQQFIEPIGARGYWRRGKWNFARFDTSGEPVRTLHACDINSISVDPPPTNTPNAVQVSSTMFAYTGPTGEHTEISDTGDVMAVYAPMVAVTRQNSATGALTATGLTATSAVRPVYRKVVTTTRRGGTVTAQTTVEYGYVAPMACRARLGGGTTYNNQFDVFQFTDGTWRDRAQEDYQVVRTTAMTRSFDANGFLSQELVVINGYHAIEIPRATLNTGTGAEVAIDVLATDEGVAWNSGREVFTFETNQINYYPASADDAHLSLRSTIVYTTNAVYRPASNPGGAYSGATIYVFGPTASKRYMYLGSAIGASIELFRFSDVYVAVDETHHIVYTTLVPTSFYPPSFQQTPPTGGQSTAGAVPYLEQSTGSQQAQPATVIFRDELRKALSLGKTITDYRQNDYCETSGEMETVAVEALRALTAPRVAIDMPIDWTIEEGSVIAVEHPRMGYGPVKLLVEDIAWSLNGMGRNSQQLRCRWDTPELAAA